jgi:hypothetical protein
VCRYAGPVLIDRYLPVFDVSERHQLLVRASPERAYATVRRVDFSRSKLVRSLFVVRGLPRLLRGRRDGVRSRRMTLDDLVQAGFVPLDEDPGVEIVLGLVGRFWTPRGGLVHMDRDDFESFDRPGYARAAWNFRVEPREDGALVTTETRVRCTDEGSRAKFLMYWTVVGPASALIRRRALALAKADAESEQEPPGTIAGGGDGR